jgi:2-amino-4-hydroxy-6-hydroxymethyldihydropteridine diphosphokinase
MLRFVFMQDLEVAMTDQAIVVFLALGSNLGDRYGHLRAALERLRERVYETEPAYVTDQPRFLNAVLRGRTSLSPLELLAFVKEVEREAGRTAGLRYGPRVLDVDVLVYGDMQVDEPTLRVPHERMAERPFVLVPLAEIAPDLLPPGWSETVGARADVAPAIGDVIRKVGPLE